MSATTLKEPSAPVHLPSDEVRRRAAAAALSPPATRDALGTRFDALREYDEDDGSDDDEEADADRAKRGRADAITAAASELTTVARQEAEELAERIQAAKDQAAEDAAAAAATAGPSRG